MLPLSSCLSSWHLGNTVILIQSYPPSNFTLPPRNRLLLKKQKVNYVLWLRHMLKSNRAAEQDEYLPEVRAAATSCIICYLKNCWWLEVSCRSECGCKRTGGNMHHLAGLLQHIDRAALNLAHRLWALEYLYQQTTIIPVRSHDRSARNKYLSRTTWNRGFFQQLLHFQLLPLPLCSCLYTISLPSSPKKTAISP